MYIVPTSMLVSPGCASSMSRYTGCELRGYVYVYQIHCTYLPLSFVYLYFSKAAGGESKVNEKLSRRKCIREKEGERKERNEKLRRK